MSKASEEQTIMRLVHSHSEVDKVQNELLEIFQTLKKQSSAEEQAEAPWKQGGEAFKAVRRKLGLNQENFAKLLRMSKTTLSSWETGAFRPRFQTLLGIIYQLSDFGRTIGEPGIGNLLKVEDFGYGRKKQDEDND